MDDAKRELVQQWLLKALHDLITARSLIYREPIVLDTAAYHCQQAAEKAVKAFLIFNDHDPDRTHDVERLIDLATHVEHGFAASRAAGKRLTPLATLYRYPNLSGVMEPSPAQAEQALNDATVIYEQVLRVLPKDVHPESG
jgi:HEPN domain-containing protein